MQTYQESLKAYRDNKNTMDYAISEAMKEKTMEIVKAMKLKGVDLEVIVDTTGLSKEQLEKL